jgi:hypothetical protein
VEAVITIRADYCRARMAARRRRPRHFPAPSSHCRTRPTATPTASAAPTTRTRGRASRCTLPLMGPIGVRGPAASAERKVARRGRMKRVNIEDAFVGEPTSRQADVEAQDSDEAIVLAVRGAKSSRSSHPARRTRARSASPASSAGRCGSRASASSPSRPTKGRAAPSSRTSPPCCTDVGRNRAPSGCRPSAGSTTWATDGRPATS